MCNFLLKNMSRRKIILPNWSLDKNTTINKELIDAYFENFQKLKEKEKNIENKKELTSIRRDIKEQVNNIYALGNVSATTYYAGLIGQNYNNTTNGYDVGFEK